MQTLHSIAVIRLSQLELAYIAARKTSRGLRIRVVQRTGRARLQTYHRATGYYDRSEWRNVDWWTMRDATGYRGWDENGAEHSPAVQRLAAKASLKDIEVFYSNAQK